MTARASSPGCPNPFVATRYHSLVVRPESVPADLEVTATSTDGVVMGLRHRSLPVEGGAVPPRVGADRVRAGACWPTSSDNWASRQRLSGRRPADCGGPRQGRGGSVLDVVVTTGVVVVVVVVVVAVDWQTEMFTVLPLVTCALGLGSGRRRSPAWPRPHRSYRRSCWRPGRPR